MTTRAFLPRTDDRHQRIRQHPEWEFFAGSDWLDRIMSEVVTDRLHEKQGRSIARWTLERDGRRLVVYLKRHYQLSRWRGWLARLFPRWNWSPGLREWDNIAFARDLGFAVPRAMAAGEFLGPRGQLQSFLAVEELTGMLPLHQAIPFAQRRLSSREFDEWKRGLMAELARIVRRLHQQNLFHKDLYLCHFYVAEGDLSDPPEDWNNRVWMIDLHRLGKHPLTRAWWLIKDLAQLLYSSDVPGITDQDRLRFWRAYRSNSRGWVDRLWARLIRAKCRLYQRHNQKC